MKYFLVAAALALAILTVAATLSARAQDPQQTRIYDSRGNSIGTVAPQGDGSTRYYDARGNSLGTSSTTGNTTTFYGSGGNVTGRASGPVGSGHFGGGRR